MDTPDQVEAYAAVLRSAFDVVEESGEYANRGTSRMVRKYMDLRLRVEESEFAWHTVRIFTGRHPLDDVECVQYEVTHSEQCHALPPGAQCWFNLGSRSDWWPGELGIWRIRPVEQVIGGDEDGPELAEFFQIQAFNPDAGTWRDWEQDQVISGDVVRCDERGGKPYNYRHEATGLQVRIAPVDTLGFDGLNSVLNAGQHLGADAQRQFLAGLLADAGLCLGDGDRGAVNWLAGWEWPTVAAIASWICRAQEVALTGVKEANR
ncbi:hypothetical protein [Catenulispora sp. GP43]|uniref:hypothetical protein n=1 Tax=Catenulispora sp. GP43 TaxID=3156263 RepID=UPI003517C65A